MMTISLAGGLLLLPMLLVQSLVIWPTLVYVLYFLLIAGLMFLEHLRRSSVLNLGLTLSATWALYRIAILVLIMI